MTESEVPIEVELFAGAKELANAGSVTIIWQPDLRARDVLEQISQRCPNLEAFLPHCRLAVDMQYVGPQHHVDRNAKLALIPPVSGG